MKIAMCIAGMILLLAWLTGMISFGKKKRLSEIKFNCPPPPRKKNHKGLSRCVNIKNVQVKSYTETSTADFVPPKGVRPNTTSSIKNFKR